MRRSYLKTAVATVAALTFAGLLHTTVAEAQAGRQGSERSLVGAWMSDITPTLIPPFASLGTISADGTLTNISSSSMGFPPESPGYGVWTRAGRNTYRITFATLLGDGAGNLAGTAKIRATVELTAKGKEFKGPFQVDVFDTAGTLLVSDTGTVHGRRITVEPLP
jgi:hypothetical protein